MDDTFFATAAEAVDFDDRVLLGLLLYAHPGQMTLDEIARELDWQPYRTEDAVKRLVGIGLVNRHGPVAFASRAAVRSHALAVV
jgi:DNA-binding MarR family transcriptional regulator